MHYYFGPPMHLLSGVDRSAGLNRGSFYGRSQERALRLLAGETFPAITSGHPFSTGCRARSLAHSRALVLGSDRDALNLVEATRGLPRDRVPPSSQLSRRVAARGRYAQG